MSNPRRGLALVGATAAISGVSITLNAYAVKGLPPSLFTGAKNLLVAVGLVAVILATRQARDLARLDRADWGRLALIGLVGGSVPFLLFFHGLSLLAGDAAGGALASFLHKTIFLPVAIFAVLFLRERLDGPLVLGAALLLAGAAALVSPDLGRLEGAHAFVLAAVLLWAAEMTLSKSTMRRLGADVVAFGRMGFGAAFVFAWLLARGEVSPALSFSAVQWGWILLTSAFLFGYVVTFYRGLALIDASSAASVLALGLVVSFALDALLRGIPADRLSLVGAALILVGVGVMAHRTTVSRPKGAPRASA